MKRKFWVAAAVAALIAAGIPPALAQVVADTTVHVGTTLNDVLIAYSTVVGTIVAALVSWAGYRFMGIKLDQEARNAIETFTNNAAGGFLVKFDTLKGINVDVHNPLIADAANAGLARIPDALNRFGLGVDELKKRIVEKIGIMTAADTTTTPAPVVKPATPLV